MKFKIISLVVSSFLAVEARAELSKDQTKQAQGLIDFYKAATGYDEALPLIADLSDCKRDVCAYNYETDREEFGILVATLDGLWTGFQTDPNGVSVDGPFNFTIDPIENGEVLAPESVKAIGDKFEKALVLADVISGGPIDVDFSVCRTDGDYVSCALNFETGREHFGVLVHGLINSDKNSIGYINTLTIDPNGVDL